MANLIPTKARQAIKREYWVRTVSVWMLLIGTAFFMVAALKIPVFVLVNDQLAVLNESYEAANQDNKHFKELENVIEDANDIGKLLQNDAEQVLFSEIVDNINNVATKDIHITNFDSKREVGEVKSLTVAGKADNRVALADFRSNLESNELFESAALPLSNLAKDKDISFNITIVLAKNLPE